MIANKILQSNSPPTKAHLTMKQLRLLLFVVLIFSCDDKEDTIEEEFIAPIIVPNGSEQYLNLSLDNPSLFLAKVSEEGRVQWSV